MTKATKKAATTKKAAGRRAARREKAAVCGAVFRRIDGSGGVRECQRTPGHAGEHWSAAAALELAALELATEGAQLMVPGVPPLAPAMLEAMTTQTLRLSRREHQRQRVAAACAGHANWTTWALATLADAAVRS